MECKELLQLQRRYFASGATLPLTFRRQMLEKLYTAVKRYETEIACALQSDLGKSSYESFMCETGLVLGEISFMKSHLRRFARERAVATPLPQFCSRSYEKNCPYGNVLIMSPWNYPVLLTLSPLSNAIAAGNTAILKPSAYAPATAALLSRLVKETFPPEYVAVVTGGREENRQLLEEKFDLVFFTGSQTVGREVLRHTAETLTPAVLELGGKSPCIVDATANLSLAAKRIVFGKFLNCGQTCVAPDYVWCHKSVKDQLVAEIVKQIEHQYGKEPLERSDYGKIINEKHYHRVMGLISGEKVITGGYGQEKTCRIAPTVMDGVCWDDPVMQQEIFGPVLPVLTFDSLEQVYDRLQNSAKPLALYLFSSSKANIREVTSRLRYGGGCINDTVIHLATSQMGFGGVGESGMGAYHGKRGFDAFSHTKSIVDKKTWLDLPMRYSPYRSKLYRKLLQLFLR